MARIPLPVQSYETATNTSSTSRLLNCFAEKLPDDAKTPVLLARAPGVIDWATVGNGPINAMLFALGTLFVVSGSELYSVNSVGTATLIGNIGVVTGSIDMDRNIDSIVIVNEPSAYYYDGTTFGQITDVDFTARGASDVEFLDNYLLFIEPDSGRFFGADLGSATSFDSLNFATAEATPDDLVGLKVDHRQAVLLGEESVEIWENTGAAGFPFERAINGFVEIGCFNGDTVAKIDNSVFWLANDYTVRRLDGVTPLRISNHAVEQSIQSSSISTAKAFAHTYKGHLFYVLSFNEVTWVYDATTRLWHERQSFGYDRWNVNCHAQAYGYELVGSFINNKIGKLDADTYTEWGATQRMHWVYQPIYAEQQRALHDRLEIVCETGVGLTTGQGSDPQMMLDYSDDGGKTWTSLPNRSIGALGQYQARVVWNRLGSARQRVYRGAVSDPVRVNITDTLADIRGGRV